MLVVISVGVQLQSKVPKRSIGLTLKMTCNCKEYSKLKLKQELSCILSEEQNPSL